MKTEIKSHFQNSRHDMITKSNYWVFR